MYENYKISREQQILMQKQEKQIRGRLIFQICKGTITLPRNRLRSIGILHDQEATNRYILYLPTLLNLLCRNGYSYSQLSLIQTPGGFEIYSNYIKFELYEFLQRVFAPGDRAKQFELVKVRITRVRITESWLYSKFGMSDNR